MKRSELARPPLFTDGFTQSIGRLEAILDIFGVEPERPEDGVKRIAQIEGLLTVRECIDPKTGDHLLVAEDHNNRWQLNLSAETTTHILNPGTDRESSQSPHAVEQFSHYHLGVVASTVGFLALPKPGVQEALFPV